MLKQRVLLLFFSLFLASALAACEEQGPAEQAGEKIDKSVEKMGEKMEEAGEQAQESTNR